MENEFEDFSIDLSEGSELEGYALTPVAPADGYVKDVYLSKKPEIVETKDKTGIFIKLSFETKDGGRFSHNILNPNYKNGDTAEDNKKITLSNINKIKHIFSALIPTPYISKVENGKKVIVKPELDNMKFSSLKDFFEHLVRIVPEDATKIPLTLKLVSKKGRTEFPNYPSFIASAWNGKTAEKDFKWDEGYDFLTSKKVGASSNANPDNEGDTPDIV